MLWQAYRKAHMAYALSYLIVLGLALFFAKGVKTLHPSHFLVLALAVLGLGTGGLFTLIFRQRNPVAFVIFQIVQGAVGFALARFVFNLNLVESCAFPLGALLALLTMLVLLSEVSLASSSILLTILLAGGLALALRLLGVFGGLIYTLALLNGFWFGMKNLEPSADRQGLWAKAMIFAAVLVAGRAAIQYYLLESNYASLGVVITHPYTFVALFLGICLPGIFWIMERERILPTALTIVLLGIVLPIVMGVFLHVRPMAGYLLGLTVASFMAALLFSGSEGLALLTYLNLGAVSLGLPLFKEISNLSRLVRLEILGGLFVVTVVFFLLLRLFQGRGQTST